MPRPLLRLSPGYCSPTPAHTPHPPILLGGHAPTVLQRVARYADGGLPTRTIPGQVEASHTRLDSLATARGRDPASVPISVFGQSPDTTRAQGQAFLNAGAVRVAVWAAHGATAHAMRGH
jgi:alkanesulfonate monooxygenase SsuD/methylene tetrahydromethanopterin reductase-like flavin-dependent oxidoreductase (luciferase family)